MIIKTASYLISSPDFTKCPVADRPEYAFIGRSNVGKSSLINMLCNNEKLAKTSNSPGKTQMINHFVIESSSTDPGAGNVADAGRKARRNTGRLWYLVDLPGYGFAKISQSSRRRWEQMIENYLRKRTNLVNVFILIDARHSPQKIDLAFLEQLKKWEIPFTLIFTKSDKETQAIVSKNVRSFLAAMRKTWQFLPQHFVTSSLKKTGRDKILSLIQEMNTAYEN
ncbi:MAG: YihA family ribosome biogenesis GTP-binding protein [Chitinophagaceae bacterium]|nr:YihA family ribosome biogenesis GTP-binding protein [Chitinophagaceae bacterium]